MKVLYFDLGMGAAGDMLTAALYELLDGNKKKEFIDKINKIFVDKKVAVSVEESVKCGITGTHFRVIVDGEEEHSHDHHHEDDHDDHEHYHEHDCGEYRLKKIPQRSQYCLLICGNDIPAHKKKNQVPVLY